MTCSATWPARASEKWDQYDWSHPEIEGRIIHVAENLDQSAFGANDCGNMRACNPKTVEYW